MSTTEPFLTLQTDDGEHRWRFRLCSTGILCSYSLTVGTTCHDSVTATLDPDTMAPRPGRWSVPARALKLDLLPDGAIEWLRHELGLEVER